VTERAHWKPPSKEEWEALLTFIPCRGTEGGKKPRGRRKNTPQVKELVKAQRGKTTKSRGRSRGEMPQDENNASKRPRG